MSEEGGRGVVSSAAQSSIEKKSKSTTFNEFRMSRRSQQ